MASCWLWVCEVPLALCGTQCLHRRTTIVGRLHLYAGVMLMYACATRTGCVHMHVGGWVVMGWGMMCLYGHMSVDNGISTGLQAC